MKKLLTLVLMSAMVLGLCACGGKKSDKTFTVGFDAEFPPYGYMNEAGEYVGLTLILHRKFVTERAGNL